jgi:glycosyltransferase involved in cell wall biosynthesis
MAGKRILFLTHLYPPAVGGAERLFQRLGEGLGERGHSVSVLTSDAVSTEQFFTPADNGLPRRDRMGGVRVFRESIRHPAYSAIKPFDKAAKRLGRAGVLIRPFVFGPHYSAATFRRLLREGFEVVVAGPVPTTSVFYALLFRCFASTVKLVFVPCMHTRDKLHVSPINLWAMRKAEAVATLSEDEREFLAGKGVQRSRLFRVAAAVDDAIAEAPASLPGGEGEPTDYVLYLGQEGEHKRIPLLIKAMTGLWAKGFRHSLVIAGARTQHSAVIDRLIAAVPPTWRGRIFRFSDFSESRKVDLLDGCRLLVNPSSFESFGIVFLEAWARRKPVVGSCIRAVREIIRDGENGFLFEDRNAADLEEKIASLLTDVGLSSGMGEAGFREVQKHYRWAGVVADFERIVL